MTQSEYILQRLSDRRKELGVSREWLAHCAGCSLRTLENMERGVVGLPLGRLEKLSLALGLRLQIELHALEDTKDFSDMQVAGER